jgi:hypothetical protein
MYLESADFENDIPNTSSVFGITSSTDYSLKLIHTENLFSNAVT